MNPFRPKNRPEGFGSEKPDPKPLFVATGLNAEPTLEQTIARVLRAHQAEQMVDQLGVDETPEEAEDFDIADDPIDALTRFEYAADALPLKDMKARLTTALSEKPGMREWIERTFGHLFSPGELPKAAPKDAPKERASEPPTGEKGGRPPKPAKPAPPQEPQGDE